MNLGFHFLMLAGLIGGGVWHLAVLYLILLAIDAIWRAA